MHDAYNKIEESKIKWLKWEKLENLEKLIKKMYKAKTELSTLYLISLENMIFRKMWY